MQNTPSLAMLFSQLGLASSPAAIELYVRTHQLPAHINLHEAPFWNKSQREFLISHLVQDDIVYKLFMFQSLSSLIFLV